MMAIVRDDQFGGDDRDREGMSEGNTPPDTSESSSQVEPEPEPDDYCPPTDVFGPTPLGWDEPPSEEAEPFRPAETGARVTGVLVVILSLGLLACAAWAVKLHRDKAQVTASFDQTLAMIAEVAPPELGTQLAAVRGDLQVDRLPEVSERISTLAGKVRQAMASGEQPSPAVPRGPIPDSAYKQLPADAATFFRQHEELFRRFLAMVEHARQLRDQGRNVNPLRKVRDSIIEAARLGQSEKVETHMQQMARLLDATSGRRGAPPGKLAAKAQAFERATRRAVQEGRDPRAAVAVARQAEQAAQAGDLDRAEQLLDQALGQVKRAPKARRASGRWGGPGGPRPANPLDALVSTLMRVMQLEERDLSVVWGQLTRLQQSLKGDQDQTEPAVLEPYVGTAMHALQNVAGRRRELTLRLRGQTPRAGRRPADGPRLGTIDADRTPDREHMLAVVSNRLGPLLERIRGMSASDFVQQQAKLVEDIARAVLQPITEEELAATPPPQAAPQGSQAERIRAKLLAGATALQRQELAGDDTSEVQDLFTEARRLLYAGDLGRAEEAADKALTLLGVPLKQFGSGPGAPDRPRPELYDPEATKLELVPGRAGDQGGDTPTP